MSCCLSVLLIAAGAAQAATTATAPLRPPPSGKIPVAFVLTEGATMIDFAGPWEVFQDVMVMSRGHSHDEAMPFQLFTVSENREPIHTSGGMAVVPDYGFDDAPAPKVVVVGAQRGSPKLLDWLRKVAADKNTDVVMSVCTGAFKLGAAGLLDGKSATTHHDYFDDFQKQFPKVKLERGRRFVRSDAHIFTAGGLTSGIDLALSVVAGYFGEGIAQQTAEYMEYQGTGWREPSR